MHDKTDSYTLSCRSSALPYPKHGLAGAHAEPLYIYEMYIGCLFSSRSDWRVDSVLANQRQPQHTYNILQRRCKQRPTRGVTVIPLSTNAFVQQVHRLCY